MKIASENVAAASLILALAVAGCASLSPEALTPASVFGMSGGGDKLTEPANPPHSGNYAAETAAATLGCAVRLRMQDDDLQGVVVSENVMGSPVTVGTFAGGAIVERAFQRFVRANFREPVGQEKPAALLSVSIGSIRIKKPPYAETAEATVRISVELSGADGGGKGYARDFSATSSGAWGDERTVPSAFYSALEKVMADFAKDWARSGAADVLARWAASSSPDVKLPELTSAIAWSGKPGDGVFSGKCTVACNGYEGFQAKTWAAAQIAEECRRKLGGIEKERVRVIYDADGEKFDPVGKTWTLAFRAFARAEKVFSYDETTRQGTVTGDLGLMNLSADAAAERLKAFAIAEMDARAGVVKGEVKKGAAMVRFDDFDTDKTYNLITIRFRLVY